MLKFRYKNVGSVSRIWRNCCPRLVSRGFSSTTGNKAEETGIVTESIQPGSYSMKVKTLSGDGLDNTLISGYGEYCFIVNERVVDGSLMLFQNHALTWNVYEDAKEPERPKNISELTADDFYLLQFIKPELDLLIIGTGSKMELPSESVLKFLRGFTKVEIQGSRHAVGTFNMLNLEGRRVAAAILAFPGSSTF